MDFLVCHLAKPSYSLWKSFCGFLGKSTQKTRSSQNRAFFLPSSLWVFISFPRFTVLARSSSTMLNGRGETGSLHLVPGLGRTASNLVAWNMTSAIGFLVEVFHQGKEKVPVYSQLATWVFMNAWETLSNTSASTEMIWFFFFKMMTQWINFWMLNQPCNPLLRFLWPNSVRNIGL